jgi:lipopolysaccharide export system permease protein
MEKILFITANRLGDAVLSTGILTALIRRYPLAEFTVACGPTPAPLFRSFVPVARVIPLVKGRFARHWRHLWQEAIKTRWDVVVDLRGSPLPYLLRARQKFLWRKSEARLHKVEELARVIGESPAPAPRLWLEAEAMLRAQILVPREGPVLALGPGANSVGKRWPAERYAALAQRLTALYEPLYTATIILLGDAQDWQAAQIIAARCKAIDLTGQLDLRLTAACLARADFYIGNDSGLTHMAAALNIPTLALFGPGVAWKYRPWGPRAAYASAADDPARDHDLCRDGDAGALALMERLSVEDAVAAAEKLWHKVYP